MKRRLKHFVGRPWFRLASTYLGIIMLMSIGFSFVFYNTSSHELYRQIPPGQVDVDRNFGALGQYHIDDNNQSPTVNNFLQQRAQEGQHELLKRLLLLNVAALVIGSYLSYYLARITLKPIEDAMEAQIQFVSDASHELRTPLTAIQAGNEVALRDNKLNLNKAKSVIRANSDEAAKLQALSNGLLNLARQDTAHFILGPLNLQAVVSQAMTRVVQPAQMKDITIDDVTPNISVRSQEQALIQILVILLDNAIKYSPAGSTVVIEGKRRGKYGYVSVRDAGIGIRASDLPHIFRRFYRADTVRGGGEQHGYGLGLSIAHKLVEQLQATITVHSELSKGSIFTVRLPLS